MCERRKIRYLDYFRKYFKSEIDNMPKHSGGGVVVVVVVHGKQ